MNNAKTIKKFYFYKVSSIHIFYCPSYNSTPAKRNNVSLILIIASFRYAYLLCFFFCFFLKIFSIQLHYSAFLTSYSDCIKIYPALWGLASDINQAKFDNKELQMLYSTKMFTNLHSFLTSYWFFKVSATDYKKRNSNVLTSLQMAGSSKSIILIVISR